MAGRPLDPEVTTALHAATLRLLSERGVARTTIAAVAEEAGVGKPTVYRRYRTKTELLAEVIASRLPVMDLPDLGDSEAELELLAEQGFPADAEAYVALIGGIMAERERHPELLEAFREHVLLPRRAQVRAVVERAQARGVLRDDVDPTMAFELFAGQILARAFAGAETSQEWLRRAYETWRMLMKPR